MVVVRGGVMDRPRELGTWAKETKQERNTKAEREDTQQDSEKPEEKPENKVGPAHPERNKRRG